MTEKLKLGENHRRAISVLLREVERMCEAIDSCLQARPGALQRLVDDLTAPQRRKLARMIESLRAELGRLEREIELDAALKSPRRTILALLSAQIVNLQESTAAGLRGYGPMPETASRKLDAETAQLILRLEEMIAVLAGKS
ncbi:MAG TPA: hypothetical protein VGS20_03875 [Candidatus Acidoferrales bacterium]|nr:hypothetical protein [Candidatus Acidoferrales bacterium]